MRKVSDIVKFALAEVGKPALGGPGHCLEDARTAYGIGPIGASAKIAAANVPARYRNPITEKNWKQVPAGAMVFYPTLSPYGHVVISVGNGECVGNDYERRGYMCKADVRLPNWHGMEHAPFYTFWTPVGFPPKG